MHKKFKILHRSRHFFITNGMNNSLPDSVKFKKKIVNLTEDQNVQCG